MENQKPQGWIYAKDKWGEPTYIHPDDVDQAEAEGYEVKGEVGEQVDKYLEENKGIKGASKVFLGQMADEFALGIPELIYDKTNTPLEVAKKEALKKQFGVSNMLGGVAGFGSGLVVGAPLFKGASLVGEQATKQAAKVLGAKAAGEIGEKSLKNIAKNIVAKSAGTGLEGALLSSPYALTEGALGDWEAAGETMLLGAGVGSVLGGAGALVSPIASGAKKLSESVSKRIPLSTADATKKLTKVFSGVPEDDISHYIDMVKAGRHETAKPAEIIKEEIDDFIATKSDELLKAKEELSLLSNEASSTYKNSVRDLQQTRAPEKLADDLVIALDNEKSEIGRLSTEALDYLDNSLETIPKAKLMTQIDDMIDSLKIKNAAGQGVIIGDTSKSAASALESLKSSISILDDEIPLPQSKQIIKQLDPDITWGGQAGVFNKVEDRVKKDFRRNISDELKAKSPEYARVMNEMAPRLSLLKDMSKKFGTKEKAITSLNSIMSPKGTITDKALAEFSALTKKDWISQMDDFKRAKDLLEEARRGDVSKKLIPELSEKVELARMKVAEIESQFSQIKRLTPARTQSIIRNQGFKNASIEDRKALEVAEMLSGKPLRQDIRDSNVIDSFSKERTQGSRRTLLGAALGGSAGGIIGGVVGSVIGGPVGTGIGAAIGAGADIYAGRLVKAVIDGSYRVGGIVLAEKAMANAQRKIDGISGALKRMSMGGVSKKTASIDAFNRMFRPEREKNEKMSNAKQLERARKKLSEWVIDTEGSSKKTADLVRGIEEEGAPNVAQAFNEKLNNAITFLLKEIPKNPRVETPFHPKVEWKPSDFEVHEFMNKVAVVEDPFVVVSALEDGTLAKSHMVALKEVYPKIYGLIVDRVMKEAVNNPVELPYDKRLKLSLIMGAPIDPSLKPDKVQYYQQTFTGNEETGDTGPNPVTTTGTGTVFSKEVSMPGSEPTEAQVISG